MISGFPAFAEDQEIKALTIGVASPPYKLDTEKPFRTIKIGDPKIVDVQALSDRTVVFQALAAGSTNIIFLDDGNVAIKDIGVVVIEGGPGRVEIHNKQLINSYTLYRCWDRGCRYVEEVTMKEPAPSLPTTTNVTSTTERIIIREPNR